jgi:TolB protein
VGPAGSGPGQLLVDVAAQDDFFVPSVVTITVGSAVRWRNAGQHPHSTTSDDGWWSWGLVPGGSFAARFLAPGVYRYHCVYHASMRGEVRVAGGAPPTPTQPTAPTPPTGQPPATESEIAYDSVPAGEASGNPELFTIRQGGTPHRLTFTPDVAEAQPSWSPDQRQLAFTARDAAAPDPGAWSLFVLDLATGQRRQITNGREHYEPDWRADGRYIAFTNLGRTGGVPDRTELAVVAPDGSRYQPLLRLYDTRYGLVNPFWAPDNVRLGFVVHSNAVGGEVYEMNTATGSTRRLFAHPGWDDVEPAWSPDGRRIALASGPNLGAGSRHDIWVVDMALGVAGAIAQHTDWDLRQPAWSPDGSQVVFSARFQRSPDRWALYVTGATGGAISGRWTSATTRTGAVGAR